MVIKHGTPLLGKQSAGMQVFLTIDDLYRYGRVS
jgi:hypothetical protein